MATVKSMLKSANLKSLEGLFWALTSVVGIILMGVTYTYIDKLEKIAYQLYATKLIHKNTD